MAKGAARGHWRRGMCRRHATEGKKEILTLNICPHVSQKFATQSNQSIVLMHTIAPNKSSIYWCMVVKTTCICTYVYTNVVAERPLRQAVSIT